MFSQNILFWILSIQCCELKAMFWTLNLLVDKKNEKIPAQLGLIEIAALSY